MKYLVNQGGLEYLIKAFNKDKDVMTLVDPHTEKTFKLHNALDSIRLGNYRVVTR